MDEWTMISKGSSGKSVLCRGNSKYRGPEERIVLVTTRKAGKVYLLVSQRGQDSRIRENPHQLK